MVKKVVYCLWSGIIDLSSLNSLSNNSSNAWVVLLENLLFISFPMDLSLHSCVEFGRPYLVYECGMEDIHLNPLKYPIRKKFLLFRSQSLLLFMTGACIFAACQSGDKSASRDAICCCCCCSKRINTGFKISNSRLDI